MGCLPTPSHSHHDREAYILQDISCQAACCSSSEEEQRNSCFAEFGENDENLTTFLKTAYKHGISSMYCCSGHGIRSAYVMLKVNDDNIELLRKLGKVLSKEGVTTDFENHHISGLRVCYRSHNRISTDWLKHASEIIESPELFDDNNPTMYYHEQIFSSYKPFSFDLKKKILNYLRKTNKQLLGR